MTLTLKLTTEQAQRVQSAKERGVDVEALLHGLIERLPISEPEPPEIQEDWDKAFMAWVESHNDFPALPSESFSRESHYGGRG